MTASSETNSQPWIANYPSHVKWDMAIPQKPLYAILDEAVAKFPDNVAINGIFGEAITYKELAAQVDKAAEGFRQQGIKKGDTVGILLPNSVHFVASYFGALKAGAKVVALSPMDSAADVASKVEDSEAKIVVTLQHDKLLPLISPLVGKGHLQKLVVEWANEETLQQPGRMTWEQLLNNNGIAPKDVPAIDPLNDVAVLQYTGGTTGKSKGAELTHQNLHANVIQSAEWFADEVNPGKDKIMGVLPFFHIFAMTTVMNFAIKNGLEIISHALFDEKAVLEDIQNKKPTLFPAVPTMLDKILNFPGIENYDLSSLKSSISGGMPLTDETRDRFKKLTGGNVVEGYGLTEASPIVAANMGGGREQKGVGLPVPGTTIEIRDLQDPSKRAAAGESGEICVKGPQVMKGYWKNPEASKGSFTEDGFLRTGDVGIVDEKGFVVIQSRLKEMIIAGGFNIYPSKLENVLKDHPAVKEAAVIGIPHPELGERPKAFVVLHDEFKGKTTLEDLAKYMNDQRGKRLSAYEKMGEFEVVDELPKTPIGKIDKKVLTKLEEERRAAKAEAPEAADNVVSVDWATRVSTEVEPKRAQGR